MARFPCRESSAIHFQRTSKLFDGHFSPFSSPFNYPRCYVSCVHSEFSVLWIFKTLDTGESTLPNVKA